MSLFLFRGLLQCVLLCNVMAALNVYFSNVAPLQMEFPRGYVDAARCDRSRHSGGVLLLCRDDLLVDSVDCEMYYVSATSEIIGVRYQEKIILCVYQQPSATDTTLIDSLTRFRLANSRHSIIIVSDFNVHECDRLSSPFMSLAGTALRKFCELFGLSQLVDKGTRKDAVLDLAISKYTGTVSYHPHLGTSDHIAIFVRFAIFITNQKSIPLEICPMELAFSSSSMGLLKVRIYF